MPLTMLPTRPLLLLLLIALLTLLPPVLSAGTVGACRSSSDCDSGLSCTNLDVRGVHDECTDSSIYCICASENFDTTPCSGSDGACRDSETCFIHTSILIFLGFLISEEVCIDKAQASALEELATCNKEEKCSSGRICVSDQAGIGSCLASAPGEGEDCVAVQSLRGVAGHMLVKQMHAMARVLCDGNRSCATKGHMVEFRRRAMMMESYCALVECREEVMLVNSPRYARGARYESHTEGLLWTPFAARYGSRVEEHLLRTAIHSGL